MATQARQRTNNVRTQAERKADSDVIVGEYRDILTELGLLTTVSVLLFGFLLSRANQGLSLSEKWLLFVALITIASAVMTFLMPVAYHRIQFPYGDWSKFQIRSHWFVRAGLLFFLAGFYASTVLAVWPQLRAAGFAVASGPIAIAVALFVLRKHAD